MGYCLKPNIVYATNETNLGTVIFQPVNGDIQLYGTNVTKYSNVDGKKRLIIPEFNELIKIWDDLMQKDTVNPMNSLVSFIGFTSENPEAEVWVNTGINNKVTPAFNVDLGQ